MEIDYEEKYVYQVDALAKWIHKCVSEMIAQSDENLEYHLPLRSKYDEVGPCLCIGFSADAEETYNPADPTHVQKSGTEDAYVPEISIRLPDGMTMSYIDDWDLADIDVLPEVITQDDMENGCKALARCVAKDCDKILGKIASIKVTDLDDCDFHRGYDWLEYEDGVKVSYKDKEVAFYAQSRKSCSLDGHEHYVSEVEYNAIEIPPYDSVYGAAEYETMPMSISKLDYHRACAGIPDTIESLCDLINDYRAKGVYYQRLTTVPISSDMLPNIRNRHDAYRRGQQGLGNKADEILGNANRFADRHYILYQDRIVPRPASGQKVLAEDDRILATLGQTEDGQKACELFVKVSPKEIARDIRANGLTESATSIVRDIAHQMVRNAIAEREYGDEEATMVVDLFIGREYWNEEPTYNDDEKAFLDYESDTDEIVAAFYDRWKTQHKISTKYDYSQSLGENIARFIPIIEKEYRGQTVYYTSPFVVQAEGDTLDYLKDLYAKQDVKSILLFAQQLTEGREIDLTDTYLPDDERVLQDSKKMVTESDLAAVSRYTDGSGFEIWRKVNGYDIQEELKTQGLVEHATDAVREIAARMGIEEPVEQETEEVRSYGRGR